MRKTWLLFLSLSFCVSFSLASSALADQHSAKVTPLVTKDPREVVSDRGARYFGALLGERTLVPGDGARLGEVRFQEWLGASSPQPALQPTR